MRNLFPEILVLCVMLVSPSLSLAEEDVIYWDDPHKVRQEKGKDAGLYIDALFRRTRGAKTNREAWDAYVAIQKEIPEELISKERTDVIPSAQREESQESARLMAWKEMRALLEEVKKSDNSQTRDQFLNTALGSKPSEEPFRKFWKKAREDMEFSRYDGFEFSWLVAPHLPTEAGGLWAEKIGDAFVERGDFLRAYAQYKAIKDHSVAYNERIEKKLNYVKEGLGDRLDEIGKAIALEGLKLSDGTIFRLVMEERGMHKEKTPYLEIRFDSPQRIEGSPASPQVIRKKIYDFESSQLNSEKYGPLLIRDQDKILLMPQVEQTFLVFDLNGMLLEKKLLTKEIASRYEIKLSHELLFSEDAFALIPKGIFNMGSPAHEEGRYDDEALHAVKITEDFYLQRTEVTQLQWYLVTAETPSHFRGEQYCKEDWNKDLKICPNHPVEQISWNDVQQFIQRLNEIQTTYTYRLPTEAEWEYAARLSGVSEEEKKKFLTPEGSLDIRESDSAKTRYGFGNSEDHLEEYGWYYKNANNQTHSVLDPRMKPIGGLYNMHGNVWEWVSDWHDKNYGLTEDQLRQIIEDPKAPPSGSNRVARGGSWGGNPRYLRSAYRLKYSSFYRGLGVRLLRQ